MDYLLILQATTATYCFFIMWILDTIADMDTVKTGKGKGITLI